MAVNKNKYSLDPILHKVGWCLGCRLSNGKTSLSGELTFDPDTARGFLADRADLHPKYFLYEIVKFGAWYCFLRSIYSVAEFDRYHRAPEAARSAAASGAQHKEREM